MTTARRHIDKTQLTPEEKLKAAYFHLIKGVAQHTLADMFDVNPGRVNTAIEEVSKAIGWPVR